MNDKVVSNGFILGIIVAIVILALIAVFQQDTTYSHEAPEKVTTTTESTSSVKASWDEVEAAPRYEVQLSPDSTLDHAKDYETDGDATQRTVENLSPGTTYYVRVRVITEDGEPLSMYSKMTTAKTEEEKKTEETVPGTAIPSEPEMVQCEVPELPVTGR